MQLYYLPFYFQAVKGASTILSGVYLMAVNIILFPIAVTCGILMTKLGTFAWANQIGFAVMTLANGIFIYVDQNLSMSTGTGAQNTNHKNPARPAYLPLELCTCTE